MPVLSGNPGSGLLRVPPLSPSPEHIPHPVVQSLEYLCRYDRSVIIRPADNDGVQSVNGILLHPCFRSFDYVTDLSSGIINRLLGWLYHESPFVLTEVPAQKVKAVVYMGNLSLLFR